MLIPSKSYKNTFSIVIIGSQIQNKLRKVVMSFLKLKSVDFLLIKKDFLSKIYIVIETIPIFSFY